MKKLSQWLIIAGVAVAFGLSAGQTFAQGRGGGRGNFDPEQFRQRMMERYKEMLEVTNDSEWKVIETRITKVMEARREVGFGGMGRGFMGRRPGGDRQGGDRPGRELPPEVDALQKALDAKAPAGEIKSKLEKFRAARKQKQAALDQAQDDLKKVLSVRQEALACMAGLIQ